MFICLLRDPAYVNAIKQILMFVPVAFYMIQITLKMLLNIKISFLTLDLLIQKGTCLKALDFITLPQSHCSFIGQLGPKSFPTPFHTNILGLILSSVRLKLMFKQHVNQVI